MITSPVIVCPRLIWKLGRRRLTTVGFKTCPVSPIFPIQEKIIYSFEYLTRKTFYLSIPDMEQCGIPRMIKNGDFILSSTNGKLVALYSCYHGFKLKGAAAVVCQGNQWSDQPPQCTGT